MPNFLPPPLLLFLFLISASQVSAHGRMKTPPPLDGPAATDASGNAYNGPLSGTGADFPCKGLHLKPSVDKTPKATWAAGSRAFFELVPNGPGGGEGAMAAHSGGSCQASISYDNGGSWKVLHTYQGGCPRGVPLNGNIAGPDQKFEFDVPAEAKSGDALFSWTWTAVTGNRDEYYMNCAAVKITGSGTSKLEGYEDMWVGDMNLPGRIKTGECRSKAGLALVYPNPGPAITITPVSGIPFGPPTSGTCFVGLGKRKSTSSGSGDSGQGAGSSSGGGTGSGSDGSSVVTKSESMVVPSATTSISQRKTTPKGTTTATPLAGNGSGSGGGALIPTTTAAATTPVAGGSGTQTTDPGNGPMFPTTQEAVVPSKTLLTPGSGTKTKMGAGNKSTSVSCGGGGNDGSGTGTGAGSGSGSGTGSGLGSGTDSGSGNGTGSGSGSGTGSGSGSGAGNTNVDTGGGANTTPATTQKPFTKIYTPTTFQTKYTSVW